MFNVFNIPWRNRGNRKETKCVRENMCEIFQVLKPFRKSIYIYNDYNFTWFFFFIMYMLFGCISYICTVHIWKNLLTKIFFGITHDVKIFDFYDNLIVAPIHSIDRLCVRNLHDDCIYFHSRSRCRREWCLLWHNDVKATLLSYLENNVYIFFIYKVRSSCHFFNDNKAF